MKHGSTLQEFKVKATIPEMMQAVQCTENGKSLTIGQIPIPQPGPGQVLVRMAASPINPADLGFLEGSYGVQNPSTIVPGFEGSGTVIAAGAGLLPRMWLGRRVACAAPAAGTWAEYLVTRAALCVPLPNNISLEQGAMLLVNPMTALALFDIAKSEKHPAIVNTAAASALGRMILRLGHRYRMPVIQVVRRQEQVDLLHSLGAEFVLLSSDPNFYSQLHDLAHRLKATLSLDAVGGELTQQLLNAAPHGSTVLLYANLSGKRYSMDLHPLEMEDKRLVGFFLGNWAAKRNLIQVLTDMRRVQRLAATDLQTTIQKRLPLSAVQQAVELYVHNMTGGKILLVADPERVRVDG
jgi:NADPH:quinone reductase-like Zn-dependent oxidoreductase